MSSKAMQEAKARKIADGIRATAAAKRAQVVDCSDSTFDTTYFEVRRPSGNPLGYVVLGGFDTEAEALAAAESHG